MATDDYAYPMPGNLERDEARLIRYMAAPKRVRAILDGEDHESWWLTDNSRTFIRWGGDWMTVRLEDLTLIGHGLNDPEVSAVFPRSQRAAFKAAKR